MERYNDTSAVTKFIGEAGFRSAGNMAGAAGTAGLLGAGSAVQAIGNTISNVTSGTKVGNAINKVNKTVGGKVLSFLNPFDNPTTAVMGATSGYNKYQELLNAGYDKNTALKNATFTGYVSAITEKMGYDGKVPNFYRSSKGIISGDMTSSLAKNTSKILKNYLSANIGEGVEEIYNAIFERIGDKLTGVGYVDENGKLKQR